LNASTRARRLEALAAADSDSATSANQTANDYMLAVVFSASCLFFAGISVKLQSATARIVLVGLASVLLVAAVIWLATLPVR
jgi:hypothetical protein